VGVEPTRPFGQRILSPSRLPFRHPGSAGQRSVADVTRSRTSNERRGRWWTMLMTLVAAAAVREAAFARNKARTPLVIPDNTPPVANSDT
jgi:hypothetical protein